ncbi:MAG: SUMF1/EgtB/PvdO family nonheme iron enzyme [Anaerolineae bacterium]|nr:SUMF1/EgtB/PvdO family nonheme iron enzyme [Anaerolineae bacterium]MDW8173657.1 SUMF1/EgtB/PvdO family nonheme iron enzyme [Anaerolineae bacterium]
MIGSVVGTYTILAELGRGGMAVVYRARQARLERDVALKMMLPGQTTPELVARFENEAKVIARFNHPHIVRLHVYDMHEGQFYYVTDLAAGGSLADLMRRGPLSLAQTNQLLKQVCEALDYAHQRQVVHRDLKPSNVLLDESNYAIVADFGLAKQIDGRPSTQSGSIFGTTLYMAPEQWQARALGPQTDIYALGIMAYEMLTGHAPFRSDNVYDLMVQHINAPLPDISAYYPAIGQRLQEVLSVATAKKPSDRYPSARDFIQEFLAAQDISKTSLLPSSSPQTMQLGVQFLATARTICASSSTNSQFQRVEAERSTYEILERHVIEDLGSPAAALEEKVRRFVAASAPDHNTDATDEDWEALAQLRTQVARLQALSEGFRAQIEARQTQPFLDKSLSARLYNLRDSLENACLLLSNSLSMLDDTEARWKLSQAAYQSIQGQLSALLQAHTDWQAQMEEHLPKLSQAEALDDQSSRLVFSLERMAEALAEQFRATEVRLSEAMSGTILSKSNQAQIDLIATQHAYAYHAFQAQRGRLSQEYERRMQAEATLLAQAEADCQRLEDALAALGQPSSVQSIRRAGQALRSLSQDVEDLEASLARKIIFATHSHQERSHNLRQRLDTMPQAIHQQYRALRRLGRQRVRNLLETRNFSGQRNRDWQPYITFLGEIIPNTPLPEIEFCLVPTGGFYMGSKDHPDSDEQPIHAQIFERPFWIGRHPLTNDQWRVAVAHGVVAEPDAERSLEWYNNPAMGRHPVVGVNWFECLAVAEWLHVRLPTEAEWEYAARGVERWRYPWGMSWDEQRLVWEETSKGQPADVESFKQGASWVGALHMLGNVWEWTSSLYVPYPYVQDEAHENFNDRSSPRVLRGCSWRSYNVMNMRAAHRGQDKPQQRYSSRGVRLACSY